jgi:hypothetical protein
VHVERSERDLGSVVHMIDECSMVVACVRCRGDVVEKSVCQLIIERPTFVSFRCIYSVCEVGELARSQRATEDEPVELGALDNHRTDDHGQPDHRVDHRAFPVEGRASASAAARMGDRVCGRVPGNAAPAVLAVHPPVRAFEGAECASASVFVSGDPIRRIRGYVLQIDKPFDCAGGGVECRPASRVRGPRVG